MKTICVALLGIVALVFGAADILVWAGVLDSIDIGILTIGGDDFFRWAWGGLVLACGGMLMLSGARNIDDLQQCGKVVLGAILAGIIACTDIFAAFCESVPAGEESPVFFNSLELLSRALTGTGVEIVGQFHDEIVVDWNPGRTKLSLDQVITIMENCMSIPGPLVGFPLEADIKHAHRYIK